jgi:dCTP deaminase
MILTRNEILKQIKAGRIKIEPFNEKNIGPASIDLTLDSQFRVFKKGHMQFEVTDKADFEKITTVIKSKSYRLKPGELIHGITVEKITLPENICGWIQGRSRFARLGLMVHITAAFAQPGISNKQVLELFNAGNKDLIIKPGTKVCQFIFEECKGKGKYKGRFRTQENP